MNIKEIIDAWITAYKPTDSQLKLANERFEICNACPEKKELVVPFCKQCGCPIGKKVFTQSENPCPLKKWGEVDKGKLPELKKTKTLT